MLPILTEDFVSILGAPGEAWSLRLSQSDPQIILFAYPHTARETSSAFGYVQPQVRLEIGARSDHWPTVDGTIEPYAATGFPNVFERPQAVVRTLAAERTFWEKVTLLHAEHHRPPEKSLGPRLSRHYYDVVRLYQGDIGQRALAQPRLLESVVRHKSLFFRSGWANYQTAVPGSIRLSPTEARVGDLKRDYQAMTDDRQCSHQQVRRDCGSGPLPPFESPVFQRSLNNRSLQSIIVRMAKPDVSNSTDSRDGS